ncbi:hypothetical protein K438DRAFT_1987618 [Mycena galopus ATCC 62051]|nr:hypothetical protein K438DRAFT_1987618 [Mycena galopus ATCC 62051]
MTVKRLTPTTGACASLVKATHRELLVAPTFCPPLGVYPSCPASLHASLRSSTHSPAPITAPTAMRPERRTTPARNACGTTPMTSACAALRPTPPPSPHIHRSSIDTGSVSSSLHHALRSLGLGLLIPIHTHTCTPPALAPPPPAVLLPLIPHRASWHRRRLEHEPVSSPPQDLPLPVSAPTHPHPVPVDIRP